MSPRCGVWCLLVCLPLLGPQAWARKLDPQPWVVTDVATGQRVAEATDNRIETRWSGPADKGLLIDLGKECVIHRVYLTPGAGVTEGYSKLRLTFLRKLDDPQAVTRSYRKIACEWWKVRGERKKLQAAGEDFLPANTAAADLRFDPIPARYVLIEGAAPIAELEVYGSTDKAALDRQDAVVLPAGAPDVLRVAAEDLRYYIGELTDRPLPIVEPAREGDYPGTLYKVLDLAPLAKTYEAMAASIRAGKLPNGAATPGLVAYPWGPGFGWYGLKLPDGVNVELNGREVLFKAWPYRNVAYSVWEFLRRQGVIWSAMEDHADFVPAGKGVNLAILPLRCQPTADQRFGGISLGPSHLSPFSHGVSFYLDDVLFLLRNGNGSVMATYLDTAREVPPFPDGQGRDLHAKDLEPEYREGFEGHPHNLHSVIPDRLLQEHADWCGMRADGKRLPPSKGGAGTFCFTNPEAIQYVADKAVYWAGENPESRVRFRLVPSDGSTFCQCERCTALCKPFRRPELAYCAGPRDVSEPYFHFVAEVAKRVKERRPRVTLEPLAYADYYLPPRNIDRMPDNVSVQVCIYGVRNLPLSDPANAKTRAYLEEWSRKCAQLTHWDYLLIHSEWRTLAMPIPMVTAIVDREKFLAKLGLQNGLTQADNGSILHNPWNHYAHLRMLWDGTLTADRILDEFFTAYYQEAKAPMLAYYKALEDHLLENHVSLEDFAYDLGPNPDMFTPALVAQLQKRLEEAEKSAASWYVRQRVRQTREDFEAAVPAALRRSLDRATALKYGKKEYVCTRRRGAIVIDGKLDDAGWQGVAAGTGFTTPAKYDLVPTEGQTEFRMAWDDEKLYVAVRCANPRAATLPLADNVWGTDNFEFFLVPESAYTAVYYQAAFSAAGNVWGPKRFFNVMWATDEAEIPPFAAAVTRQEAAWTCEFAVPFAALKIGAPKPGQSWRMNIVRGGRPPSSWSRLPIAMWHLHRDFDFLTFAAE